MPDNGPQVTPVIRRGVEHNARWLDVTWRGHDVLSVTWRLARWDRERGRYFELWIGGWHAR